MFIGEAMKIENFDNLQENSLSYRGCVGQKLGEIIDEKNGF